jgi:hypothetical protein
VSLPSLCYSSFSPPARFLQALHSNSPCCLYFSLARDIALFTIWSVLPWALRQQQFSLYCIISYLNTLLGISQQFAAIKAKSMLLNILEVASNNKTGHETVPPRVCKTSLITPGGRRKMGPRDSFLQTKEDLLTPPPP